MSRAGTGPGISGEMNKLKIIVSLIISMFFIPSIFAGQFDEVSKKLTQPVFWIEETPSDLIWAGYHEKKSELCTSPVDGSDCSDVFSDYLKIEKNGLGYLVKLRSTQARQSVCSFEYYMVLNRGRLIHETKFGSVTLQKNGNSFEISSKEIDPTALGLGVCGVHADIEGLKFPLSKEAFGSLK